MIDIYTDGSCDKYGLGAWAFIVMYSAKEEIIFQLSGSKTNTTNNRMELTAAISALRYMSSRQLHFPVTIHSDSICVVGGFTKGWEKIWKRNNWINSRGIEIKNRDLLEMLLKFNCNYRSTIKWVYVRGDTMVIDGMNTVIS
jgi:ribonuclease HI